jgi:hypothetical protein
MSGIEIIMIGIGAGVWFLALVDVLDWLIWGRRGL